MTCALYRHFDADGRLLYVGVSSSPFRRMGEHASSEWAKQVVRVEIAWYDTAAEARKVEAAAIEAARPPHNTLHAHGRPRLVHDTPLGRYIAKHRLRQIEFARRLGISQTTLSRMISGERSPGLALASRIAVATGGAVPIQTWIALAEAGDVAS